MVKRLMCVSYRICHIRQHQYISSIGYKRICLFGISNSVFHVFSEFDY